MKRPEHVNGGTDFGGELSQQTVDLLSSVIASRVEAGKVHRSSVRMRPSPKNCFSDGGTVFDISRLGVPGSSSSTVTPVSKPRGLSLETRNRAQSPALEQEKASGGRVRYIHIPKHALNDFRSFARDVAREATREVATQNPYVQALCRHREELQAPLVVPAQLTHQTKEQLLATQREALGVLRIDGDEEHREEFWHPKDSSLVTSPSLSACSAFADAAHEAAAQKRSNFLPCDGLCLAARQSTKGEFLDEPNKNQDLVHAPPLPMVGAGDSPSCGGSTLSSNRSALSTTCSRQSACEDCASLPGHHAEVKKDPGRALRLPEDQSWTETWCSQGSRSSRPL